MVNSDFRILMAMILACFLIAGSPAWAENNHEPRLVAEFDCTKEYPADVYFGHGAVSVMTPPRGRHSVSRRQAAVHVHHGRYVLRLNNGCLYRLRASRQWNDAGDPADLLAAVERLQHPGHDMERWRTRSRGKHQDLRIRPFAAVGGTWRPG